MVRADVNLGSAMLQGIFSPWYVPDVYDVYGSNWAGVQPGAEAQTRTAAAAQAGRFDPTLFDFGQRALQQTSLPAATYARPSAGARLSGRIGDVDASIMYHYGYDGPLVRIDQANATLSASYVRRHHVGIDATVPAGPFVLSLDAGFEDNRVIIRRDLTGMTSAALQMVATIEYQTGDIDKVFLVEALYQHLFADRLPELLAWQRDTVGASALIRWPLFGPVRAEARLLGGIRPLTYVARVEVGAERDGLYGAIGVLGADGDQPSFGWYYRRNKELYALVKYSF
jgi:hypothetical protein